MVDTDTSQTAVTELILHNYFRSSTSIRVRVALHLKRLEFHYAGYALLKAEHRDARYLALNPQGLVPTLQISKDKVISQSLAIIEYLEERFPTPPLLPDNVYGRARVRSLAMMIACDIHPLNNLRVLKALREKFSADDQAVNEWFSHWVHETFSALEYRLVNEAETGDFCHGDTPGLADICLYAQVLNNQRFAVDMSPYPRITEIFQRCDALDAFIQAHPSNQPDAS